MTTSMVVALTVAICLPPALLVGAILGYLVRAALVERQALILGWHALRLCEGRGVSVFRHALRRASERATQTLLP